MKVEQCWIIIRSSWLKNATFGGGNQQIKSLMTFISIFLCFFEVFLDLPLSFLFRRCVTAIERH